MDRTLYDDFITVMTLNKKFELAGIVASVELKSLNAPLSIFAIRSGFPDPFNIAKPITVPGLSLVGIVPTRLFEPLFMATAHFAQTVFLRMKISPTRL